MKVQSGFTLLEVLIAMLVLSVGLLGLSGLQTTGLKNNLSAYHRSQATQLAYSIADRMRTNVADAQNFATSTYITLSPAAALAQASCTAAGCTILQMAENDLFEWQNSLTNTLPSGQGTITVSGTTFTISISWDDNRDGVVDGDDPNFQMDFQL